MYNSNGILLRYWSMILQRYSVQVRESDSVKVITLSTLFSRLVQPVLLPYLSPSPRVHRVSHTLHSVSYTTNANSSYAGLVNVSAGAIHQLHCIKCHTLALPTRHRHSLGFITYQRVSRHCIVWHTLAIHNSSYTSLVNVTEDVIHQLSQLVIVTYTRFTTCQWV